MLAGLFARYPAHISATFPLAYACIAFCCLSFNGAYARACVVACLLMHPRMCGCLPACFTRNISATFPCVCKIKVLAALLACYPAHIPATFPLAYACIAFCCLSLVFQWRLCTRTHKSRQGHEAGIQLGQRYFRVLATFSLAHPCSCPIFAWLLASFPDTILPICLYE